MARRRADGIIPPSRPCRERRQEPRRKATRTIPVPLPLDGTLDLHAFAPSEVGSLVPEWIEACHAAGLRELRIVHGKGTGALRRSVDALLARHPLVASWRTAGRGRGRLGSDARHAPVRRAAGVRIVRA